MPPQPDPRWAYFLDIDGTLVALAGSPDRARLEPAFRHVLERVNRSTGGAVALISGRSIRDIDRLLGGLRFPAAGQHGLERRNSSGRTSRPRVATPGLGRARDRLCEAVERHPGLLLEDKGLSLALHYRQAPRLAGYAHRLIRSLVSGLGPAFCVQRGKRVVELRPAGRDKGIAMLEFMEEPPFRGRVPVFIGDDLTDEHAFATVNGLAGWSVKVGPGPSAARWRLRDVPAVQRWLERIPTDQVQ
ncbi:MAG TPA: trehalose-phosphatase [Gemmatimonadales bacterium]|nr:trehalose-phosphatase [Gemmatimonadales bacterium]